MGKAVKGAVAGKVEGMDLPKFPKGSYFHKARTTLEIYNDLVTSAISKKTVLLDAGCGKKSLMAGFKKKVARQVGMDISLDAIHENNAFNVFAVGDAHKLPFADDSFDVVVSQWMIEHIKDPNEVMKEFHRVLKKGGHLIVATNSLYHPMMLLSAILPMKLRDDLKDRIFPSYIEEDTFPTYYKFNALGSIHKMLSSIGFEKKYAAYTGAPFFMFSKLLFKVSEVYERVTDISPLRCMKMHVVVHYVKS
ncbi:MAG: class I SAM-dependent methyltransferase [Deltaproteobacteria bacterium]|nr:class I SAM-dependent methyltransferase [Deltaproteobacteria bacterium]